jgi:hypothetical protein
MTSLMQQEKRPLVPRIKSLLKGVKLEEAKRAHNCQANSGHRIRAGEMRLSVRNQRGNWDRYCLDCATKIVRGDLARLEDLASDIAQNPAR